MAELFGRVVELAVGNLAWRDLHVVFRVQKTVRSKPNPAEIRVDNLSEASRHAISQRLTPVRLLAGYQGQVGLIFSGEVDEVLHRRDGAGWTTVITASDGRAAWGKYVGRSWKGGTPYRDVVQHLAGQMGLIVPASALAAVPGTSRRALALSSHAHREMDLLMAALGLEWSIQDGALQVVRAGDGTVQTAILLGPESGLVGSPELAEPGKGKRPTVKARALLQPGFTPGRRVELRSAAFRGLYRVDRVDHHGDTHGGDFVSELYLSEVR